MEIVRQVIVTGSRDWVDRTTIWSALSTELDLHGGLVLIHGACPSGADDIADRWAAGMAQAGREVEVVRYPASWDTHGKAAGIIRNKQMANQGADVCYAFPLKGSRGTNHMMAVCREAEIPVINLGYQGEK